MSDKLALLILKARKRSAKVKRQAKSNIRTVIRAAKPLLPEDAEPHYIIIALANAPNSV
jgi:hypothetical protein